MVSKDFNDALDDYISSRRQNKGTPTVTQKKKRSGFSHEENIPVKMKSNSIYVIKKPKTIWQKVSDEVGKTSEADFEARKKMEKTKSIGEEQAFEQEYDEMQKEERKTSFFTRIKKFFSSDVDEAYEDMDDEEKVIKATQPIEKKPAVQKMEKAESQPVENKQTKPRKSFFSKLSSFFGLDDDEEAEDEEKKAVEKPAETAEAPVKQDMKEVAKFAVSVIKRLPKAELERLKSSPDFGKFKEILKRNNLSK